MNIDAYNAGANMALKAYGIVNESQQMQMMQQLKQQQMITQALEQQKLKAEIDKVDKANATMEQYRTGMAEILTPKTAEVPLPSYNPQSGQGTPPYRIGATQTQQMPISRDQLMQAMTFASQYAKPGEMLGLAEKFVGGDTNKLINVAPGATVYDPNKGTAVYTAPGRTGTQNLQSYFKLDDKGNITGDVTLDENDPKTLEIVQREKLVRSNDPRILQNRSITNINLQGALAGPKAFAEKSSKDMAEDWQKSKDEGIAAQINLARIQEIKKALSKGYQGKLASLKANAGAYYEAITGQPVAKAQETQVAQAIANRLALTMVGGQVAGGGMPANLFSEADREFVIAASANPKLTPEANTRLLNIAEKIERFKQAKGTAMTEYIIKNRTPDANMYPYVERRVAEIFGNELIGSSITQPSESRFKILEVK